MMNRRFNPKYVLLALVFVLVLGAVLGSIFVKKSFKGDMVYIFPYLFEEDPFIQNLSTSLSEKLSNDYNISIQGAQNSQVIQSEQIQEAMSSDPLVLCINPVDRLGSYSIINALRKRDIPVIFFNRQPLTRDLALWRKAYYVGAPAEQAGRLQAELLAELFVCDGTVSAKHAVGVGSVAHTKGVSAVGAATATDTEFAGQRKACLGAQDKNGDGKIQIIFFKGEQSHQDAEVRFSTVVSSLAEMGYELDILAIETANWQRNLAASQMQNLIIKYGKSIEAVVASNDAMALGAISAIKSAGLFRDDNRDGKMSSADASWFPVVGVDGLPESDYAIETGYLYATVHNNAEKQAEYIARLVHILSGKAGYPVNSLSEDDIRQAGVPLEERRFVWVDYEKRK